MKKLIQILEWVFAAVSLLVFKIEANKSLPTNEGANEYRCKLSVRMFPFFIFLFFFIPFLILKHGIDEFKKDSENWEPKQTKNFKYYTFSTRRPNKIQLVRKFLFYENR